MAKKIADDDALLRAMLAEAAFEGWTPAALAAAATAAGLEPGRADLIYPRGVRDAVAAFAAWTDARMLEAIDADRYFTGRKIRDKIGFAIRSRLQILAPHREAVRQLTGWGALPHRAPELLRLTARSCDAIWRAAGDTSTDFNFYTKRGLLAYVLQTTMLFWLQDDSPGQTQSRAFAERRIAEVLQAGQRMSRLKELPRDLGRLRGLAGLFEKMQGSRRAG